MDVCREPKMTTVKPVKMRSTCEALNSLSEIVAELPLQQFQKDNILRLAAIAAGGKSDFAEHEAEMQRHIANLQEEINVKSCAMLAIRERSAKVMAALQICLKAFGNNPALLSKEMQNAQVSCAKLLKDVL